MGKSKPIGLGIVGLGRAGWGMHCKELEGKEGMFRIVAGCDTAADRRRRLSDKYHCPTYARVRDLIADENVEMIDIATRSNDHLPHTMLALKSGKDVFLEKPITLTYAQAKRLKSAADRAKGNLYIRHNRRFEASFNHVREIIKTGILGRVYQIKLARTGYRRRDDWQTLLRFGGGQLLNWGPHIIDHALLLMEAPVESVWGDLKRIAACGNAEDHVKIVLTGTNGRVVDIEITSAASTPLPWYIVWGSKGSLTCDGKTIEMKYLNPRAKLKPRRACPGNPGGAFGTPEKLPWVEKTLPVKSRSMYEIWDAMYAAVRKGKKFPITLDQSLNVMRVISAVKKGTKFESSSK